jgi:hypothetical protein
MPVENGSRLTSHYSNARNLRGTTKAHWGTDFGGITPGKSSHVYAVADGVVTQAKGPSLPYRSGPALVIDHLDGGSTYYGHVRNVRVSKGQRVRRGDVIAETWHTGIPLEWGIHLHLERWTRSGDPSTHVNPLDYLEKHGWVIENGRLYDRQPATIVQHSAPVIVEKEIDMANSQVRYYNHALRKEQEITLSDATYNISLGISNARREIAKVGATQTAMETVIKELASESDMDSTTLIDEIHRAVAAYVPEEITIPLSGGAN